MKKMYYNRDEEGTIYGLKSLDFTEEQLTKVNSSKLLEFIGQDPRVANILATRISSGTNLEDIRCLAYLDPEDWESYPDIKVAYNIKIPLIEALSADKDFYSCDNLYFWHGFNEEKKLNELKKLANGTIRYYFNFSQVDFKWVCEKDLNLARELFYKNICNNYYSMIQNCTKDLLEEFLPQILDSNNHRLHLLENPNVPENVLDSLLRDYAKRGKGLFIMARISNKVLLALPPITRLEVLEKIVPRSSINNVFVDIKNKEDFRELLFGSMARYPQRVEALIKVFESRWSSEVSYRLHQKINMKGSK